MTVTGAENDKEAKDAFSAVVVTCWGAKYLNQTRVELVENDVRRISVAV